MDGAEATIGNPAIEGCPGEQVGIELGCGTLPGGKGCLLVVEAS